MNNIVNGLQNKEGNDMTMKMKRRGHKPAQEEVEEEKKDCSTAELDDNHNNKSSKGGKNVKDKAHTNGKSNDIHDSSSSDSSSLSSWKDVISPTMQLSSDNAFGHQQQQHQNSCNNNNNNKRTFFLNLFFYLLRFVFVDLSLMILFGLYVGTVVIHKIHDDYLLPQIKLMKFIEDERDYIDTTYYHRFCNDDDITARSLDELLISPTHNTTQEAVETMLLHGASMYPNLLSKQTSWSLREYIAEENYKQEGWFVIENEHRYSWGIDMDMHPAFRSYWKELAANKQFVEKLEAIVGPDPAIIEFTAITSAYGAKNQYDHQDVVPPASGTKFARTFIPSYSLFIPLQDTSYDMGATHVCPGTHLCSKGTSYCPKRNLPMSDARPSSDDDSESVWPQGWGAFVNQQTIHKGMGHSKKGALDRVVIIATFAPRPQTSRGILETRMIGQGGSYSLKWDHWGHTFSDYVQSEKRMTPIKRVMRSLGLMKGNGWNIISVASMRMSNDDNGYNDIGALKSFRRGGGFWFLPKSWQGAIKGDEVEDDNFWYKFLIGTLKRTEQKLKRINVIATTSYAVVLCLAELIYLWWFFVRPNKNKNNDDNNKNDDNKGNRNRSLSSLPSSIVLCGIRRMIVTHGFVLLVAYGILNTIHESNWAKDIKNELAYRLPVHQLDGEDLPPETIPIATDILKTEHYSSDYFASYAKVVDYSQRGNRFWMDLTKTYSTGYAALSEDLQQQFCTNLMQSLQTDRRILKQDIGRSWIVVDDQDELLHLCRQRMVRAGNQLIDALAYQIEALRTEAHYGRFRRTTLNRLTTPKLLDDWEHRLIPLATLSKSKQPMHANSLLPRNFVDTVNIYSQHLPLQRHPLPPRQLPKEPYKGAWLQTGDIVEGKYNCKFNEWYKGTILRAFANSGKYTVGYDDGEVDEDLSRKCVRRYVPYLVGESTEVAATNKNKFYLPGKVVRVYHEDGDELYDIQTEDKGLYERVPTTRMRRVKKSKFKVGDRVYGFYAPEDEWFPGRIVKKNSNGTYKMLYDDGEYEDNVQQKYILPKS